MSFHSKTYAPRSVVINFSGVDLSDGKVDGDFLTITPNSDRTVAQKGADGNSALTLLPDHSCNIDITYFMSSNSATKLIAMDSALREAERNGQLFSGDLPLVISDGAGIELFTAESAVFQGVSDRSFGMDGSPQITVTFYCEDARTIPVSSEVGSDVNKMLSDYGITVNVAT